MHTYTAGTEAPGLSCRGVPGPWTGCQGAGQGLWGLLVQAGPRQPSRGICQIYQQTQEQLGAAATSYPNAEIRAKLNRHK